MIRKNKNLFLFIFLIGFFTPAFNFFNKELHVNQFNIETRRSSVMAGSAIALKTHSNENILACSYSLCLKLNGQWQFFGIKLQEENTHKIFLYKPQHGWGYLEIPIDRSLFALKAPAKIRLPAQVQKKLDNDDQIKIEAAYNKKILLQSKLTNLPCHWNLPIKSKKVSEFASVRTLPNGITYPHKGLDLRAPSSTPIHAVADGVVLSTDQHVVGGDTVNIDHGKGVISRYLHLSKFLTHPGQQVKKGQVIGLSGSSGRAEAPHLHWEMRLHGVAVDPVSSLDLLSQTCDLK